MFSEIEFWTRLDEDFIKEFKLYIDNILSLDLNLSTSEFINVYADCTCANTSNNQNRGILERLSVSLGYMIENRTIGHKNYITDSLRDWASVLYEMMYW